MNQRRHFIKLSGLTGLSVASADFLNRVGLTLNNFNGMEKFSAMENELFKDGSTSVIGAYGLWAAGLTANKLPSLSFRNSEFTDVDTWKKRARNQLTQRLAAPGTGMLPKVTVKNKYSHDGLSIEELSWQLPYGPPTDGVLLKPADAKGKLPAILAFHDHGGVKYFGTRKIIRTGEHLHPLMQVHQEEYYGGVAWANEIAKRGYVVLVADAFPFASRRVLMNDVPAEWRNGLTDDDPENSDHIKAYDVWAANHEHVMAKSLLSAGTTWPGVFYGEDLKALDILCARPDVDTNNIGCGGLSGGGMRTVFMAGQDDRIKCAVCVGFMTTWKDFVLNKSPNHTWMTYVPLLPNELDFPEILGLRVPLPTLVLNNINDDLYTPDEMKRADNILQEVYQKAVMPDRYKCSFHPGPHKFDRKMQVEAFEWFDRWLRK